MPLFAFLIIVISFLGVIFLGYFFYFFFFGSQNIKRFFKINIILFPIGLLLALIIWYVNGKAEPESFKEAVNIITNNSELISKVGTYESYSYKTNELPMETDNPANIKIVINGSKAVMYLTCKMIKNTSGKWDIKSIKQDSLIDRIHY